jgi:hypothetical protein
MAEQKHKYLCYTGCFIICYSSSNEWRYDSIPSHTHEWHVQRKFDFSLPVEFFVYIPNL